jgi:hypothetical protein
MSKKYTHVFEVAFSVKNSSFSVWEDEVENNPKNIIAALKDRIKYLESNQNEIFDAVEGIDTSIET